MSYHRALVKLSPRYVVVLGLLTACSSDPQPIATTTGADGGGAVGPATFKDGVMPILSESCALAACHASKQSNLGIHITYDATLVYSELQNESPTFPGLKFVVPGKPDQSFLMAKMDGTHAKLPGCASGCGREMPPDDMLPQAKRDLVRKWIANGAKND